MLRDEYRAFRRRINKLLKRKKRAAEAEKWKQLDELHSNPRNSAQFYRKVRQLRGDARQKLPSRMNTADGGSTTSDTSTRARRGPTTTAA